MAGPEVTAALKLRDDMSGPLRDAGNNVGGFSNIIRGAAATALGFLGADVIRNVGSFVTGAIEASAAADKLNKQTEAVIKSTGDASGVTAAHIASLADSLKHLSGVQGETIQNGANLLLTFTSIRNEAGKGNDIFDQATKTMLNMSVALGEDAPSAAIQLGKALNDPIQGVTALRRVGVSFTASQLEQIKALQKSGDLMGAQKIILGELTKEFGGSAEAVGNSTQGMLDKAGVAIDDARKALAGLLLPAIGQVAGAFANVANQAIAWLQANQPLVDQVEAFVGGGLSQLFGLIGAGVGTIQTIAKTFMQWRDAMGATASVTDNIVALFGITTSTVGGLGDQLSDLQDAMDEVGNAYESGLGPIFADLGVLWNTVLLPGLRQLAGGLAGLEPRFSGLLTKIAPVVKIIMLLNDLALKQLIAGLRVLLPPAINLVVAVFGTLMDAVGVIADLFVNLYTLIDDLFHGRWGKLWGDVQKLFSDAVSGILQVVADLVVGVGQFFGELVDGIAGSKGAIPKMWSAVVAWFQSLPGAILGALQGLGTLLVDSAAGMISGFLVGGVQAWQGLLSWLEGLPDAILTGLGDLTLLLLDDGTNLLVSLLDGATAAVPELLAWLQALPGNILTGIGDLTTTLTQKGLDLLQGFLVAEIRGWQNILTWLGNLPGAILTGIGDLSSTLTQKGLDLLQGFLLAEIRGWVAIGTWLGNLPGNILNAVGSLAGTLLGKGMELMTGFLGGEKNGWTILSAHLGGSEGRILTAVGNLGSTLWNAGSDLINGFLNGIKNNWWKVTSWVHNMLMQLPQVVRDALGIKSPSTVMAGIGENFTSGLQLGITRSWGGLRRTVAGLQVGLPGGLSPLAAVTSRGALSGGLAAAVAGGGVRDVYVTVEGGVFLDDGPALDRFSNSIADAVRSRPGT